MSDRIPSETLGEALPCEMARVRDELIPAYQSIGPVGAFGIGVMTAETNIAERESAFITGVGIAAEDKAALITAARLIHGAMVFRDTQEGQDYWMGVYRNLLRLGYAK